MAALTVLIFLLLIVFAVDIAQKRRTYLNQGSK